MSTVIRVEDLSKSYRLGQIGGRTLTQDLNRWWAKVRKQPDPYSKIGQTDHGNRGGEEIWALKDVSFTVEQGEVLGIIGRNGAGKSTLLKILSRVTAPTTGVVKVRGRIASLLEVGTGFHPELTGRENIYLNGAILGMNRQEVSRKFDEIVDFAEIEQFIDTPVKRYSSGMYVRLAFAVAAHLEPEILIVDEVLAVGDAEFQKKCLGKMGEVSKGGRTVLFVSHNMLAVESLCTEAIWVDKGRVVNRGATHYVINQYRKISIAQAKMNLFSRSDRMGDGRLRILQCTILDQDYRPISNPRSGQSIIFELSFQLIGTRSIQDVSFQLSFINDLGQSLFTLITRFSTGNFREIFSSDKVYCKVDHLPLLPGTYYVHLYVKQSYQMLDGIENAIELEVIPGDVHQSGKLQPSDGGNFIVPHTWEKVSDSDTLPRIDEGKDR